MKKLKQRIRWELHEEAILIIAAIVVPLAALPGMLGLYVGM